MKRNRIWISVVLAVLFFVLIVGPLFWSNISTKQTSGQIENNQKLLGDINLLYAKEEDWFKQSYLNFDLDKLASELKKAEDLFSRSSKLSIDNRIKTNKVVLDLLKQNKEGLDNVLKILQDNEKTQQQAFDYLTQLNTKRSNLDIKETEDRYSKESSGFLDKYKRTFLVYFSQSKESISESEKYIELANNVLPNLDDKTRKGDPLEAVKNLKIADENLTKASDLVAQIVKDLDYQIEAKNNYSAKLSESLQEIKNTQDALIATEKQYGFSKDKALFLAYSLLNQAITLNQDSTNLTQKRVEGGKLDYVASYDESKKSIALSKQAADENTKQIMAYKSAKVDSNVVKTSLSDIEITLQNAKNSYDILRLNHSISCWSQVSNNYKEANDILFDAQKIKQTADDQFSASKQLFSEAGANYKKVLDMIQNANSKCLELVSLKDVLENYRDQWLTVYNQASLVVENERDLVTRYGSYSFSAKSDFDSAVNYLNSSKNNANNSFYQKAVEDAQEAKRLADGTGRRCQNAYDDDQSSNNNYWNSGGGDNNYDNDIGGGDFGGGNDGGGWDGGGNDGGGWDFGGGNDGGGWDGGGGGDAGGFDAGGGGDGGGW